MKSRALIRRVRAPLALLAALSLSAATPRLKPGELDGFIGGVGPLCLKAPARACIDRGFAYADKDRSGALSVAEVGEVHRQVEAWNQANAAKIPPADRQRLSMGLLMVRTVGPERLFTSYDDDGDGQLTKAEVLADLKLDERPLPVILGDPKAIDWSRLGARAGAPAEMLRGLLGL